MYDNDKDTVIRVCVPQRLKMTFRCYVSKSKLLIAVSYSGN